MLGALPLQNSPLPEPYSTVGKENGISADSESTSKQYVPTFAVAGEQVCKACSLRIKFPHTFC